MTFRSRVGWLTGFAIFLAGAYAWAQTSNPPAQDAAAPAASQAASASPNATPQSSAPPAALDSSTLLRKAEEIVKTYTPGKKIWVRGFRSGLRVIGVTVASPAVQAPTATTTNSPTNTPPAAAIATGTASAAETQSTLPDWLDKDALLGITTSTSPLDIRLLWKVEPNVNTSEETNEFSLKLVNHDGYTENSQLNERSRIKLSEKPFGTVFWTQHSFEPFTNSPPGLYDVYVSGTALPVETIALGQVLVNGKLEPNQTVAAQVQSLFPTGACVFGGNAVLTKWFRYRFTVNPAAKPPRTLVVVSSVDWLEDQADSLEVAMVTLQYPSGRTEQHPLLLGRDTASTWYNLHARSVVKHKLAPVAWSSRVRRETLDFDANVYQAKFDLAPTQETPAAIEVAYSAPKGILRLRGLSLVP